MEREICIYIYRQYMLYSFFFHACICTSHIHIYACIQIYIYIIDILYMYMECHAGFVPVIPSRGLAFFGSLRTEAKLTDFGLAKASGRGPPARSSPATLFHGMI